MLAPLMYKAAGIVPQYDQSGNITGFTAAPLTEAQQAEQDINVALAQREKQALAGEIPVSPSVTQSLAQQEQTLGEVMRKQVGPAWQTSTPGIEAMAKFGQSKAAILDAAQRGDISMYESMSLTQQQAENQRLANLFAQASAMPGFTQQSGAGFGQAAAGFNSPLQYYQNLRNQQLQAEIANIFQPNTLGSIFGGIGGMAMGSLFGGLGLGVGGVMGKSLGTSLFG
jgi:hypothetical protein